ncbi:MAG: response regulator [Anaerolineae bacterium]|nr:response regulator [Anaerolineae bacterium]
MDVHRSRGYTYGAVLRALQDALSHLYDPAYQPPELLYELAGCDRRHGATGVQSALLGRIRSLEPSPDAPATAPARLIYDLLQSRYVLGLTQDQTAERLHVSVATAWRLQRKAIGALARALCDRQQLTSEPLDASAEDWHSQTARELAALEANAPRAVASVPDAVQGAVELGPALTGRQDICLRIAHIQPNLVARAHPSVLYQMLVTAVRRVARFAACGDVSLFAGLVDGNVRITLAAPVPRNRHPTEQDLLSNMITPPNATVAAQVEEDHVFLWVELPAPGTITVLVVDDNRDMADFYRRATEGTSYRIVHSTEEDNLFETIEVTRPDAIVLDVMLPNTDGWKLLMRLKERPATRPIPVIVCSVVREEELALSLGASLYLPKPVRPRQFIEGLDGTIRRAPARSPTT